jgi:hypothetical protein
MSGYEPAGGRAPLYARLLRLQRLRIGGLASFLLVECTIALAILLALAEIVSWWAVLVLPTAVAVVVKFNDLVWHSPRGAGRSEHREQRSSGMRQRSARRGQQSSRGRQRSQRPRQRSAWAQEPPWEAGPARRRRGDMSSPVAEDDALAAVADARTRWTDDWPTERGSGGRQYRGGRYRATVDEGHGPGTALEPRGDYAWHDRPDSIDDDAWRGQPAGDDGRVGSAVARGPVDPADDNETPPVRRVATSLPVGPAAFGAAVRRSMAQAQRRAAEAAGRHARNDSVGAAGRSDGFNERRFGRSA